MAAPLAAEASYLAFEVEALEAWEEHLASLGAPRYSQASWVMRN